MPLKVPYIFTLIAGLWSSIAKTRLHNFTLIIKNDKLNAKKHSSIAKTYDTAQLHHEDIIWFCNLLTSKQEKHGLALCDKYDFVTNKLDYTTLLSKQQDSHEKQKVSIISKFWVLENLIWAYRIYYTITLK